MSANDKSKLLVRIGERLRAIRNTLGFTMQDVQDETGMHVNKIRYVETGSREVSFTSIYELCEAYGIQIDELVYSDDTEFQQLLSEMKDFCEVA